MKIRSWFWIALLVTMIFTVMLPDITRHSVWRQTVLAQGGLQTININNLSAVGCTQLLTGTGTSKIYIYYGQLFINQAGTGQTVLFGANSANGTGTTCAGTLSTVGQVQVQGVGTSATTSSTVSIGPGSPAIVIPTSSALTITLSTTSPVNGYLTVSQQ